ncbi:MAG TPA: VWA domain-containing protein [Candidatus Limnocylindria bacterium]|jgi:Ca-activated chloride channel family protein|nr:VWA domain-containing protein [Candidatus Limnocylindria bacterium]
MTSFQFSHPWWLLALLGIPVLAWLRGKTGRESSFVYSSISLVRGITELARSRAGAFLLSLRWLGLALFIIGLARPQLAGGGKAPRQASGIDIVVALDLSGSMRSEDFELHGVQANRVAVAKDVLQTFIDHRVDDRIGLVVFAGSAYVAAPPTLDHDFLVRNVKRLDALQESGTAIGSALSAAANRLRELKSKSRIVILMTDGQNNAGKVSPLTAADAALALGIKVYTIGVGIRGKAPYPYIDPFGQTRYQMIDVDIDEDTLTKISARTGGRYFRADNTATLRSIYEEIDKLEKSKVQTKQHAYYEELMGYFVTPGLLLLFLELILGHTVWRKLP